jgi:hypothetical protein
MRPLTTLAMLVLGAAFVASAHAQEPPRPNLLLEMSRPQSSTPAESSMRDDIQARPPGPRAPDPFGDSFRVYVGVGDARCFPGEDNFIPERLPSGTRRRMR